MRDTLVHGSYEYHGFLYEIHDDEQGAVYALPWRNRIDDPYGSTLYLKQAAETFEAEYKWKDRKCQHSH